MTTLELIERGIGHNCLSDAYELGRADAIDELMNKLCDKCIQTPNECLNLECPFADDECQIIKISEQLKEQKNGK